MEQERWQISQEMRSTFAVEYFSLELVLSIAFRQQTNMFALRVTQQIIWRANHVDKINICAMLQHQHTPKRTEKKCRGFFVCFFRYCSYLFVAFRFTTQQIKTNVMKIARRVCDGSSTDCLEIHSPRRASISYLRSVFSVCNTYIWLSLIPLLVAFLSPSTPITSSSFSRWEDSRMQVIIRFFSINWHSG